MPDDSQNADDVPGLTEEETLEALEELHHDGAVEVVPGVGSDMDEPSFRLTETGDEMAEEVLQENDDAVLYLIGIHLSQVGKIKDSNVLAEALVEIGVLLRDDAGVNVFRVLERNPDAFPIEVDFEGMPDDFVGVFDADE